MTKTAMIEKIFVLLATFALFPRWVFKIQSAWLLLIEIPVLGVLLILLLKKFIFLKNLKRD